jgi:histidyl-tRNA synthetase
MLKNLRGFPDIISEGPLLNKIIEVCNKYAEKLSYRNVFTPVLEKTALFTLLGEGSDIVRKEMFNFQYKEESVTLRPEVTASLAKSIINNNINKGRFSYYGPNFRKERPQMGRYRQFYQFGCENIGYSSPVREIECFTIISKILNELSIEYEILINHIGTEESRSKYTNVLRDYFHCHINNLSQESQKRLLENRVLRILDSKEDRSLLENCPSILEFLKKDEIDHLHFICEFLKQSNIKYRIDNRLVRGLDYYNSIVFEIVSSCSGASQNSIGGGGAYDNLFYQMKSYKREAFGFALGLERMLLCNPKIPFNHTATLCILTSNYHVITILSEVICINGTLNNLRDSFTYANKNNSDYLIIIDCSYPTILIKDLREKKQYNVSISELSDFFAGRK